MANGLPDINVDGLTSFIPEAEIETLLRQPQPDRHRIEDIIAKSLAKNRLEPSEMAALLNAEDPQLVEQIKEGARNLKKTFTVTVSFCLRRYTSATTVLTIVPIVVSEKIIWILSAKP